MEATIADGQARQADVFLHHRDGYRVPVRVRTRVLKSAEGEVWGAVETFGSIAAEMAALEQVRDLETRVFVDSLTQIANRSFMNEFLAARSAEAERYGWGLGLVMMDVDHFKVVNDTYGHDAGDAVLKMVAQTLRGATRSFDAVGRWGGEEFLAVLTSVDRRALRRVAERYRALVAASDVGIGGDVLQVTISVGATIVRSDEQPLDALTRADEAMYRSKTEGRDRVTVV